MIKIDNFIKLFEGAVRDSWDRPALSDFRKSTISYRELAEKIETLDLIWKKAGIKPKIQPIRGGTDGAMLSFRGLPCPNIFAGGLNFHGKLEYVSVESMEKATQVILNIAQAR